MEDIIEFQNLSSEVIIGKNLTLRIPLISKTGKLSLSSFDITVNKRSVNTSFGFKIVNGNEFEVEQGLKKNKYFSNIGQPSFIENKTILEIELQDFLMFGSYQIWAKLKTDDNQEINVLDVPFTVVNPSTTNSTRTIEPEMLSVNRLAEMAGSAQSALNEVKAGAKTFFNDINEFVKKDFQRVSLVEPNRNETPDQFLWMYIRNGVMNFEHYKKFIDAVMCDDSILKENTKTQVNIKKNEWSKQLPFLRTDAFGILKFATDFYMQEYFKIDNFEDSTFNNTLIQKNINELNSFSDEALRTNRNANDIEQFISERRASNKNYWLNGTDYLPYFEKIKKRMGVTFQSVGIQNDRIACETNFPNNFIEDLNLLELIWSYWHEEGGLVQTMNAISLRFQNVRLNANDPLAGLNIDPLRPINNLIWGYIEDERNRLSMSRRNLEYQYEYGISLIGKAVANIQVAESRSQFLPAFHNLLKIAIDFYQQANYTTVIPDGFPVLNSLREVHLLLSEGSHNQFGSLPWAARAEMFIQQWLLSRPEMREFLGGRIMMPYNEEWMDKVDTMKTIQGWNPTNITHFHDLGAFGEQLLLSIRYGSWNDPSQTRDNAANWAHYWREEIQRYVHAYKAATGVDLGSDVTDARIAMPQNVERYTQPSVLIGRRVSALPNNRPNQLNRLTQRRNSERY